MIQLNKQLRYSLLIAFVSTNLLQAQQENTLYFMDNNPYRYKINPAFQPLSNVFIGLPVMGYSQFGVGNNALSINDIFKSDGSTKQFIELLKKNNSLLTDFNINLLSFGFRHESAYWNFSANQRADILTNIPKSVFEAIDNGTADNTPANLDLSVFTELGLGYAKKINDKWNVGLKAKILLGQASLRFQSNGVYFKLENERVDFANKGYLRISSPVEIKGIYHVPEMPSISALMKPSGIGAAIDLGASYSISENLHVSVALNDLGMINWTANSKSYQYKLQADQLEFNKNGLDSMLNYPKNFFTLDSTLQSFSTKLAPKLMVGIEYGFWQNKVTVGLMSKNTIYQNKLLSELTTSVNVKPINWFNLTGSYSLLNGRGSTIGAGMGVRLGCVYLFASADYIPLNYSNTITFADKNLEIPAFKTRNVNLAVGFNLVFGNRLDKDRDSVKAKFDK